MQKYPSDLTEQDLPETLLFKEAYADIFKVQYCNNIDSFYEYENGKSNSNVKGRFRFFFYIFGGKNGTSEFILDVIYEGYNISLLREPKSVLLNNNISAFKR